jgi:hypothetical protein
MKGGTIMIWQCPTIYVLGNNNKKYKLFLAKLWNKLNSKFWNACYCQSENCCHQICFRKRSVSGYTKALTVHLARVLNPLVLLAVVNPLGRRHINLIISSYVESRQTVDDAQR